MLKEGTLSLKMPGYSANISFKRSPCKKNNKARKSDWYLDVERSREYRKHLSSWKQLRLWEQRYSQECRHISRKCYSAIARAPCEWTCNSYSGPFRGQQLSGLNSTCRTHIEKILLSNHWAVLWVWIISCASGSLILQQCGLVKR